MMDRDDLEELQVRLSRNGGGSGGGKRKSAGAKTREAQVAQRGPNYGKPMVLPKKTTAAETPPMAEGGEAEA